MEDIILTSRTEQKKDQCSEVWIIVCAQKVAYRETYSKNRHRKIYKPQVVMASLSLSFTFVHPSLGTFESGHWKVVTVGEPLVRRSRYTKE